MLITFSSKAYGDITLFGNIAIDLLHMMGHSGTVPGALRASDVPPALEKLKKSLETEIADQPTMPPSNNQSTDPEETPISLKIRALPLIELLSAAIKQNCDVMWDGK